MKVIYSFVFLILFFPFIAQANSIRSAHLQISYEQWHMPNHIQPMGVLGLHSLVDFNPWCYGGVGLDSAVDGEKGGFFALALEGGAQYPLVKKIFMDGGMRIGGGGGDNTPVGGGLFYEPYVGLKYDFNHYQAGIYYSYVDFVYGKINSQQIGLTLSTPFHFQYFDFSRDYIAALLQSYFPLHHVMKLDNQPMGSSIALLGIELAHFISHKLFLFFNFSGAMHGNENGYADELLGVGYHFSLFNSVKWSGVVKAAAGSAGGGAVSTGGGFIYSPMLGVEYRFNPALGLELNGGYVAAPEGHFKAIKAGVLLQYYFSHAFHANISHFRMRVLNQTYFKPRAEGGADNPTMQLLGLNFDYFIARYFYMTGQTAFAYIGKNTGGYFSGLLGAGAETPTILKKHVSLFSEMLVGTAGGAGLSIGDGALVEPVAGLQYQLSKAVALQTAAGYLVALKGQFHSVTMMIGFGYKLSE